VEDRNLRTTLGFLNIVLGVTIAVVSFDLYFKKKTLVPVYITTAVFIAGPLEDILMRLISPENHWIVDQITSLGFLIFLLLAVIESAKQAAFLNK
jgi:hypothetical protein